MEDQTTYHIYVTAVNEHGEGPASLEATVQTKGNQPVIFSQYRIINGTKEEGELSNHIVSVTRRAGTMMYNSPLDHDVSALGIADNDFLLIIRSMTGMMRSRTIPAMKDGD